MMFVVATQVYGAVFERGLEPFWKLIATTGVNVELKHSEKNYAVVSVEGMAAADVITEVKNGVLRVTLRKKIQQEGAAVLVKVYCSEIRELHISTGANVETTEEQVFSDELYVNGSTGGKARIEVDVDELSLRTTEGASIEVLGQCDKAFMRATTGGSLLCRSLQVEEVDAKSNFGSKILLGSCENLDGSASSGGKIIYDEVKELIKKENLHGIVVSHKEYLEINAHGKK